MGRGFGLFSSILGLLETPCSYCNKISKSGGYKTHYYLKGLRFCKISCMNKYLRNYLPSYCCNCGYKFKVSDYNNDNFVIKYGNIKNIYCSDRCSVNH